MSTGTQPPSARLCFFTGGLLYFESNICSFYDAYGRGHTCTGSRPERAIGSLWHRHPEGAWKTLPTATLSWLSLIPNMLCHLALLSRSLGNRWKEAPGFWLWLLSQLVTYVQACLVVLDHTSNDSHSSHTVVNVQVSCLSLWSLKLGHRYSCSHARKAPTCRFSHSLQYFTCCKRATGCDVIHSMHTFANWSIVAVLHKGCIAHIAHRCLTALHHPLKPCTIKSICPMQMLLIVLKSEGKRQHRDRCLKVSRCLKVVGA